MKKKKMELKSPQRKKMLSDQPPAIHIYRGEEIREFVPYINEKVTELASRFPYLYIPENQQLPNDLLAGDPNAFIVFGEKAVLLAAHPPISSCLESKYGPRSTMGALQEKGFDPSKILYLAFFWIEDKRRNDFALVEEVYEAAASLGRQMGMTYACYFVTLNFFRN